jgi:hypothetical protein
VFAAGVLRKMLGPKEEIEAEDWRKLQNEELHCLSFSPNIILFFQMKKNEIGWECSTCGREERCIQGLVGKPEGKAALVRPRCRWMDNTKNDLKRNSIGWR